MADSSVAITAGSGTSIDTRTESTNGNHRQVMVVGDPADNSAVVAVVNAAPAATDYGSVVRVSPTGAPYHVVTAASTNAGNIKASAGIVRYVGVYNVAAYPIYVKFHNTSSTPTAGSGVVWTVGVEAGTMRDIFPPGGVRFATGIGITVVKDIADSGTTAVAASDAVLDILYE